MVELQKIATEQRNPNTMNIDTLSTLDMVKLINQEDHRVADAVGEVTDKIAQAVDVIAEKLAAGGRLIYCGAGTSGRLGILDAVECPPTYSTDPETVQALMAGGYGAIFKAVKELYKMLPYVITLVVLIIVSLRKKREDQPPASLGLSYFREER